MYSADSIISAAVFRLGTPVGRRVSSYTPESQPFGVPAGRTVLSTSCVYAFGITAFQPNAAFELTQRVDASGYRLLPPV